MRGFFLRVEPYLSPLLAFSGLYFVSLIGASLALRGLGVDRADLVLNHLGSLLAAIVATWLCIVLLEKGKWTLGILVSPKRALRGASRGLVAGLVIVGVTDLVIVIASDYRHVAGDGLNLWLIVALIFPAAFGEELVFRGYVLQKLYVKNRGWAIMVTSGLFAVAHAGNPAMSPLAFANIFLAGIVLALMWAWDQSLWMPTLGHFAWNVMSGPILGHELSGLDLGSTVLSELDPGPAWLTGGEFGIEASVVLTIVEVAAITYLTGRIRSRDRALPEVALPTGTATAGAPDGLSGGSANQNEEV